MALYFKVKAENDDVEELRKIEDIFHDALAGSPAYRNSEIAIVEEDKSSFTLCVGEDNENNKHYDMNLTEIKKGG